MKDNYTHILFILDDSGSMTSVLDDAIGGFNSFLKEQKEAGGECRMHTLLFGSFGNFNYIHKDKNVNEIDEITQEEYAARSGMTALIDAIAKGINDLGNFLKEKDESDRPAKVLVNIFTDGHENDSREYTEATVRELIKEQTDTYNWEFTFLASDINSVGMATNMGIGNVASTSKSGKGMRGVYTAMSANALSYRKSGETLDVQDSYDSAVKEDDDEGNNS